MLKYWLWLTNLRGLHNQTRLALLRHFGTPENLFYADEGEILLTEGITREQAALLRDHDLERANRILGDCQRLGLQLLTIQDAAYPARLQNIYDPPVLLYVRGHLPVMDEEAAIAVVGNGLDVKYPRENRYLYEDVAAAGALLSEYPPGTRPDGRHFPVRNRILSGLGLAALVVEAPARSGALITAETALEQGRDVFAVPGPIDALTSAGCNRLIRDGAGLVSDAWDILREYQDRFPDKLHPEGARREPETLGYRARQSREAKPVLPSLSLQEEKLELTDDQIALLRALPEEEPMLVDDLIEQTGIPTRRVLSALTVLELEQLIEQHSGKRYTRKVNLFE